MGKLSESIYRLSQSSTLSMQKKLWLVSKPQRLKIEAKFRTVWPGKNYRKRIGLRV